MNVFLTFDIEVWCNGWSELDRRFPAAFERYVFGRSSAGDYALPKTLEMLNRHQLKGVFFLEPLFAARFGLEHLATIVEMITDAGQEVQMHLHPEWTDEIRPLPFPDKPFKRQHLNHYTFEEQRALIELGRSLLRAAGAPDPNAFRAGSFAANADTLRALSSTGFEYDSSFNATMDISGADLRGTLDLRYPTHHMDMQIVPMSVFTDATGRSRHAQVGAAGAAELSEALSWAHAAGLQAFTILSHNFELLRQDSSVPDKIVVKRFETLCRFLASRAEQMPTSGFASRPQCISPRIIGAEVAAKVSWMSTARRLAEQALRRLQ